MYRRSNYVDAASWADACRLAVRDASRWGDIAEGYISAGEHMDGVYSFWANFSSLADVVGDYERYFDGLDLRQVRTFVDQDECRQRVYNLVARAVDDVLYVLDASTGPDGADYTDVPPNPETAAQYAAFREFFGPNVAAAIQAHVVGPLLAGASLDSDGRLYLDDGDHRASFNPVGDRLRARLHWLCAEIPSLIQAYSQLEGDEMGEALDDVNTALGLDLDEDIGRHAASEILPVLERWFMFSNRGAKLMRGDQPTVDALLAGLSAVRKRAAELEEARVQARQNLETGSSVPDDAAANADALGRVEVLIARFEDKIQVLEAKRDKLISALS